MSKSIAITVGEGLRRRRSSRPPGGLRGLGSVHRSVRRQLEVAVAGGGCRCAIGAECKRAELVEGVLVGGLIVPGEAWDLDHTPDRTGYRGPAHASCNRSDGARRGNAKRGLRRSRKW